MYGNECRLLPDITSQASFINIQVYKIYCRKYRLTMWIQIDLKPIIKSICKLQS